MNIEETLAEVADELGWIAPPPVFIGGATIGLFLEAFGRSRLRGTKDVDCIVPAARTGQRLDDVGIRTVQQGRQVSPVDAPALALHLSLDPPAEGGCHVTVRWSCGGAGTTMRVTTTAEFALPPVDCSPGGGCAEPRRLRRALHRPRRTSRRPRARG